MADIVSRLTAAAQDVSLPEAARQRAGQELATIQSNKERLMNAAQDPSLPEETKNKVRSHLVQYLGTYGSPTIPSELTGSIRGPSSSLEPPPDDSGPVMDKRIPLDIENVNRSKETTAINEMDPADRRRMAGFVLGTGAGLLGGAALGGVLAPLAARGLAGTVAAGTLTGAGSGAISGGTQAAVEGSPVLPAAGHGALVGGALGAGTSLVGAGLGAVAKKIRDPRTLGGKTITALEEAKNSGALDTPEFKALPAGKEGYNQVADQAGQDFTAYNKDLLRKTRDEYSTGINQIVADSGDKTIPLEPIHNRLGALQAENNVNGVAVDEGLNKALDKVRNMLTKKTGLLASDSGQEITAQGGSLSDILKTKKAVQDMAEFGSPVTAENRPFRLIYKGLAQEAEAADPRIGPLNKKFGDTISKLERSNDIVYGKETPEISGRAAAERTAAARLGRLGDDTQAGTVGSRQLEELQTIDPKYAELLKNIEAKKAFERTRFGLPQMSKSPEKWGLGLVEQNLGALNARAVDPLTRAGAEAAAQMPQLAPPTLNPVIRAYLDYQERQKRLADNFKAGGR